MADECVLCVSGLSGEVTEDILVELFLQAGPLNKAVRVKDKDGSLKNYAFVEFCHKESVPYAIDIMDGIKLFGHHLRLKNRSGTYHGRDSMPTQHHSASRDQSYHNSRHYNGSGSSNGPNILGQPFRATGSSSSHTHPPQLFEDKRDRLMYKQGLGASYHTGGRGGAGGNLYYSSNYRQSFRQDW